MVTMAWSDENRPFLLVVHVAFVLSVIDNF
jgi:hypothetical protein